jgi:hypothetical protein
MSLYVDGINGLTFPDGSAQPTSGYTGFRNRIINGAMQIDQRNAGSVITPTSGQYMVDRFWFQGTQVSKFTAQQNAGSVSPPVGFANYQGLTSSSAYSVLSSDYFLIRQSIEGYNTADLAWGTANAKTVTLSFYVYSSLTGSFGASIAQGSGARWYPFLYTISAANTWTYITVTIPGDTTGSYPTNNTAGILVSWALGTGSSFTGPANAWTNSTYIAPTGSVNVVGTSGATFYITGVQLEKAGTATPFEFRPYGTELALCQRYYQLSGSAVGGGNSTTAVNANINLKVTMRATPVPGVQGVLQFSNGANDFTQSSTSTTFLNGTTESVVVLFGNFTGLTASQVYFMRLSANTNLITLSAEL